MRILPTLLPLLVVPAFAAAQCLTSADLATGITVEFLDGDLSVYTAGPDGTIIDNGKSYDGVDQFEWRSTTYMGVFEQRVFERTKGLWQPTTDFSLTYDFDYTAAFPLVDGAVGGGVQTLVDPDPSKSEDAVFSYSVHTGPDFLVYQDVEGFECSYETLDIYQTYLLSGGDFGLTQLQYLPSLGIGYVVASKWSWGDAKSRQVIGIYVAE